MMEETLDRLENSCLREVMGLTNDLECLQNRKFRYDIGQVYEEVMELFLLAEPPLVLYDSDII